jgi:hypothetical protein
MLTDDQRRQLRALAEQQGVPQFKRLRAHILLQADAQVSDRSIATTLHVHPRDVRSIRRRAVDVGVETALNERARPARRAGRRFGGAKHTLEDTQEASLIAVARRAPPEGQPWTLPLLADTLSAQGVIKPMAPAQGGRRVHATVSRRVRRQRKLNGSQVAALVALAGSTPPEGHRRWTMSFLADTLVTRGVVESISPATVQRTLKHRLPLEWQCLLPPHDGRSGTPVRYEDARATPHRLVKMTGLSVEEFDRLVPAFELAFLLRMERWTSRGQRRSGRRYIERADASLPTPEDRLLFILVYLKQRPTQVAHGMAFRMRQSQVSQWLHALLPALRIGLLAQGEGLTRRLADLQQRLGASS